MIITFLPIEPIILSTYFLIIDLFIVKILFQNMFYYFTFSLSVTECLY